MSAIVSRIEIARPPDEVFAYVSDPSHFPEWQYDVVNVRVDAGSPSGVGSRFTTTRRIGGTQQTMTQEVTEINAPRSWTVRGVGGPIRPNAKVTVDPLNAGAGSRVTFELDFEGHGPGKLLMPLVRRMTIKGPPKSYRNLKERLEKGD
jgi:uncharacterized protein YndB with AHSA1/START domain